MLDVAAAHLHARPVEHNLVLTLLGQRAASGAPGRYWVVQGGDEVVGVVFQSPLDFAATLTPMSPIAARAVADAIADDGVDLPGINGEAAATAAFAGRWTERRGSAAVPYNGQRLYRLGPLTFPQDVPGSVRSASPADRDVLVGWMAGFAADTGETHIDAAAMVDSRLPSGQFAIWDDGGAVSTAAHTAALAGVSRIQAVYTPPERRRHGYAAACVAALAGRLRSEGADVVLYADLGNATSNGVYRRIGFEAVLELLRYTLT